MDSGDWIALVAVAIVIMTTTTGTAVWIVSQLSGTKVEIAKLTFTINNGLTATLQEVKENVKTLSNRFDAAPCSEHATKMENVEHRLKAVERHRNEG